MNANEVYRYDFHTQLEWSKQQRLHRGLDAALRERIPGYTGLHMSETSDDLKGTDYWAARLDVPALSIDVKARSSDYLLAGFDDLALETWSVMPCERNYRGRVGWTRDATKDTDYVVWYWVPTGRFHIVPFPPLCSVYQKYWKEWRQQYWTPPPQSSGGWLSECTLVPRAVVTEHIDKWASGTVILKGKGH